MDCVQKHYVIKYSSFDKYHGGGHRINIVCNMNDIKFYRNRMAAKSQITRLKKLVGWGFDLEIIEAGIGIHGYKIPAWRQSIINNQQ